MRVLFLGDIVGRAGRNAVIERLAQMRADWKLDFVVINAENSASGYGMTASIASNLFDAGADGIPVWLTIEAIHSDAVPLHGILHLGCELEVHDGPDPWVIAPALSFSLPLSGRLDAEQGEAAAEVDAARKTTA